MFEIKSAGIHSYDAEVLRARLELEWGNIDPFEGSHANIAVPFPLILLDQQAGLAGGLAFSTFSHPTREVISVWINALLVEPEYRGEGHGSNLVRAAEVEAEKFKLKELFVLTEFPRLYQNLGWSIIKSAGSDCVLVKSMADNYSTQNNRLVR
ncbi:MAG: GNAT superfamily N-acetyltransferase [Candidatus Azotimanducaceae bacterium]|jgi:GNAT superfamily N-acetyltransferase